MAEIRMSGREWGMLLTLSVLWGGSYLFMGLAIREVPFYFVATARCVIGAIVLHIALRAMGQSFPLHRRALIAFLGMGLLNNAIPFSLIPFGQGQIGAGLAAILNAMTPIFTILLMHLFTADEKLTPAKTVGVLLGFVGVVLLFEVEGAVLSTAAIAGQVACLLAAFSYGLSNLFGRRFSGLGLTPITAAAGQLTASSLVLLPITLIVGEPWTLPMPSATALLAILALGVVSTAIAYLLYMRLLIRAGGTNTSLVTLLNPCSAILFSVLFLGEALVPRQLIGFAVIACGLLAIDGRMLQVFKRAR